MLASIRRCIRPAGVFSVGWATEMNCTPNSDSKPFKFNVIEQVPGSPVHLVEDQTIELVGVLLGERHQLLEGLAFVVLGGGFGDAEESDDFAVVSLGVLAQGIDLNVEGEPLTLLFSAADTSQCDVSFLRFHHSAIPERKQTSPFDEVHFLREISIGNSERLSGSK